MYDARLRQIVWIIGLIGAFTASSFAEDGDEPEGRPLPGIAEADRKRILHEIDIEGLADAPWITNGSSAKALPPETTKVVVTAGGRESLEGLKHLAQLDTLYIILGPVAEDDLAALTGIESLRHLHLGMERRYRLKGKLWKHAGTLTELRTLNVNCHS